MYDQLGLVAPARLDSGSGYRQYSPHQIEAARRVGLLRRLGMPLATIASVLQLDDAAAAGAIAKYREQVEAMTAERRILVGYLQARLAGGDQTVYDIETRTMPERKVLSWPALLPACDALAHWATECQRQPAGALRQLLIADQRTATADTPACDPTIPLR